MNKPTILQGLTTSIKVDGKDLHEFGYNVTELSGLDMAPIRAADQVFPHIHGKKAWGDYFDSRPFRLRGTVFGDSVSDLRDRIERLKAFFQTFSGDPWKGSRPLWLERTDQGERHYECLYNGIFNPGLIGPWRLAKAATLEVGLRAVQPFAVANDVTMESFSGAAGTFKILSLGTAHSSPIYALKGLATNPKLVVGDKVFFCTFDNDLKATNVLNEAVTGNYYGKDTGGLFSPGNYGNQFRADGYYVVFDPVIGNKNEGSWIWWGRPQWAYDIGSPDPIIWRHTYDADNLVQLFYRYDADKWIFYIKANGTPYEISSDTQNFAADDFIVVGGSYGSDGVKIYVNGIYQDKNSSFSALSSNPNILNLWDNANSKFDELYGWSRQLSDDEMMRYSTNPILVRNDNEVMSYSANLDHTDILTIDHAQQIIEKTSITSKSNGMENFSGIIAGLKPEVDVLYVPSVIGTVMLNYRKRWI